MWTREGSQPPHKHSPARAAGTAAARVDGCCIARNKLRVGISRCLAGDSLIEPWHMPHLAQQPPRHRAKKHSSQSVHTHTPKKTPLVRYRLRREFCRFSAGRKPRGHKQVRKNFRHASQVCDRSALYTHLIRNLANLQQRASMVRRIVFG